jgi:hypothetical protein
MQSSDSQELDNMSNFPRDNAFNLFDSNKPNNNIQKEKHQPAGKRPDGKFPIFNALLHKFSKKHQPASLPRYYNFFKLFFVFS